MEMIEKIISQQEAIKIAIKHSGHHYHLQKLLIELYISNKDYLERRSDEIKERLHSMPETLYK